MTKKTWFLEQFVSGYIATLLWGSKDQDGHGLEGFDGDDLTRSAKAIIADECRAFVWDNWDLIEGSDPVGAGGDFWLARNGHGAEWDHGLDYRASRILTESAKLWGEQDIMVSDEGEIEIA